MKKLLIVMVAVVFLGFVASQALACIWDGYWGDPMRGRMMGGPMMGGSWCGYAPGVNPGGAYQSFLNDTVKLRQELAAKQGEYSALMAQPSPDPKRAGEISKEIASIHDRLLAKAQASGLPRPGSHRYGSGSRGWACW